MFNLTICFGPNGTTWALLFKEEAKAAAVYNAYVGAKLNNTGEASPLIGADDYGQSFAIPIDEISGMLLEDLAAVETARIQRSLAEERCKAKFIKAATDDPVIKSAMRQQGPSVLTPMGASGFRG